MFKYKIREFSPAWWAGCTLLSLVVFYGAIFIALVAQAAIGG